MPHVVRGGAALAALFVVGILLRGVVGEVVVLAHLASAPTPYFESAHFLLLYVAAPAAVITSFVVFLAPGLVLTRTLRPAGPGEWVVLAFGASFLAVVIVGTVLKLLLGTPLAPNTFITGWGLTLAASIAFAIMRERRAPSPSPLAAPGSWRRLISMAVACALGVAAMVPKLFWEDLNLDGVEAFEFGRSLTHNVLPSWEIHEGAFGFYHNFVTFSWTNHFFIAWFGPHEAAARLPMLLYVAVLFGAIVALAEHASPRPLRAVEEGFLWAGLALFTFVQAYDTTYEPFFSDIAETAATDALWMVFFVATILALWKGRVRWMCAFGLAAHMTSAGTPLLLAALLVLTFLFGPAADKRHLRALGAVLVAGVVLGLLHRFVYNELILGGVRDQFSTRNLLSRLYPPNLFAFGRIFLLLLPAGILPAVSLLFVRREEPRSLVVAGVGLGWFAVIYASAWTGVHQFTPAMLLPLIVFWRWILHRERRSGPVLGAYAAGLAVSAFLSVPPHFSLNQAMRDVGEATDFRIGDYEGGYEEAARAATVLYEIFPEHYRLAYPEQPWGGDHFVWLHYALRPKPPGAKINYVVTTPDAPAPEGAVRVERRGDAVVYVLDEERWAEHRHPGLPKKSIAPVYEHVMADTFEFYRSFVEKATAQSR